MHLEGVAAAVTVDVDRDALVAALYQQEGAALVRLARLFTDDRNAAEDLVQEAFIRLHRNAHRIEDRAKAAAYMRSIVLNLARDHNRRGLMSLRHREAMIPEASPEAPEDRIVATEDGDEVVAALRDLPGRQRDCLVLRFYLDLTEVEIAATLDISKNSVKTHCRRGMATLRRLLEGAR
ncbi:MAG: SigE family RNA polymerase sigma factor [Actinobacteria bacterium]|nr:MAG: SigE family RNA polymerase sigma factor [Actinomycetota bacterium]